MGCPALNSNTARRKVAAGWSIGSCSDGLVALCLDGLELMARLCGSWAKARPSWRGRALLLDELLGPKNDKSPIRGDRAFVASAESGAKAGGTGLLWRLPAVRI